LCFRPFERTITLQKDSAGTVGFVFKENKITAIVKDSSAARNGVLIDHHMVEVDGQNVVGLKVTTNEQHLSVVSVHSTLYFHFYKHLERDVILCTVKYTVFVALFFLVVLQQ